MISIIIASRQDFRFDNCCNCSRVINNKGVKMSQPPFIVFQFSSPWHFNECHCCSRQKKKFDITLLFPINVNENSRRLNKSTVN
jgi:hypothetical protein